MSLIDKLSAILAVKESLLQTCGLPEYLRGYSVQSRIEESDKLLLDLLKQIIDKEEEPTTAPTKTDDDDIPF